MSSRTVRCQRRDIKPTILNRLAPADTHLTERREAFCPRVQATVPVLWIQRKSAWQENNLLSKEGCGLGKGRTLIWEPVHRAEKRSCHPPLFPSFPLPLLSHDPLSHRLYLPVHLHRPDHVISWNNTSYLCLTGLSPHLICNSPWFPPISSCNSIAWAPKSARCLGKLASGPSSLQSLPGT